MAVLLPSLCVDQVTDITQDTLRALGVRALILDVDNTLSSHGSQEPFPGALAWTKQMLQSGIKITIVSNNFEKRVAPFAEKFSLPFISMALKPLPVGYLRAVKAMGVKREETAAVGDQVFTDIAGANFSCMKSILVVPKGKESVLRFGWRRALEKPVREKARRLGLWETGKKGETK